MPRSILLLLRQIFLFKERSKDQESNPLVTVRVNSKQSVRGLRSSITDHACPSVPLTSIFIPEQNVNERPPRESYLSADKRRGGPPMDAMLSLGELQTFALAPRFLTPPIWIRFWQELMVERVRKKMLRERDWDRNLRLCTPCETKSKGGREKQEASEVCANERRVPLSECYKYDQLRVTYMAHGDNEKSGAVFLPHRCTTKGRPLFPTAFHVILHTVSCK